MNRLPITVASVGFNSANAYLNGKDKGAPSPKQFEPEHLDTL